jgi:hypothetical protein
MNNFSRVTSSIYRNGDGNGDGNGYGDGDGNGYGDG